MAAITLAQLKRELRIAEDDTNNDDLLTQMIEVIKDEARDFLELDVLPDKPAVYAGLVMFARAKFDAGTPSEIEAYRKAGETLLMPSRDNLGM
ncbi:MAG: phage head-tail connector protein [Nitrospira sp.]|nr:phage head-tail connector protein [Nitrospira sp.]